MNKKIKTYLVSLGLLAFIVVSALAAPIPGAVQSLKTAPMPSCDAANCTLIEGFLVNLPFLAFGGDVIMLDANGSISDVVRFLNDIVDTGGGTGLGDMAEVFSKIDVGPEGSAGPDLGLPTTFSVNAVRINEAPETVVTLYNGNGTIYHIVSDVPEPSNIILIGAGLLSIGALARRRLA